VLRSIQLYNALLRQGSEPGDYDLIRAAGPHGSGAAPLLRIASSLDDAHSEEHNPTTFPTTKAALSSRRAAWRERKSLSTFPEGMAWLCSGLRSPFGDPRFLLLIFTS